MQGHTRLSARHVPTSDALRWRDLFEHMQEGFFVAEAVRDAQGRMTDFRFIEVNPAFETLTGIAVKDVLGGTAREAVQEVPELAVEAFRAVVETGEPAAFEVQVPALNNRWYEARARSLGGDRFSVLFLEITARKQAQAQLVHSEERFRLLADVSPHILWIADHQGNVEFFNRVWVQYTGVDYRGEPASKVAAQHVHPDDCAHTIEQFSRALKTLKPFEVEHRIRSKHGDYRWFLVRAEPYFDPVTGQAVRWHGSSVDIHDSKLASEALRQTQARQAFLVAFTDRLSGLADPQQIQYEAAALLAEHLHASRAYYSEYDEAAGRGMVHRDFHHAGETSVAGPVRIDKFPELHRALREGRLLAIDDITESPILDAAAREHLRALHLRGFLVVPLVKNGRLLASLTVTQDNLRHWSPLEISLVQDTAERTWASVERARAEAALRQADRRKDEFLATLAHELRNPLAPLRNGLHIARLLAPADARLQRTVQMMDRQLTHMVRLVDDLMDVGRVSSGKLTLRREPVSLRTVLADSLEDTHSAIEARGHELIVDAGADDLQVLGDDDRLTQVVVNLLTNAAKYTQPGGRIRVTLARDDAQAVLRVEDNGIGIPTDDLDNVFQLFSQVRLHQGLSEGGLGIGLALVRSLVTLQGGTVQAHSEGTGQGSTFTVRLPLYP